MVSLSQLTQDALSLSTEDRVRLAQVLWDSVNGNGGYDQLRYEEETIQEALRRDEEMESGRVPGIPHEEVMSRLQKKFG